VEENSLRSEAQAEWGVVLITLPFAWDGHRLRHTPYTCGTVGFLSQADNAQSASILVINNFSGILAASGSGSRRQIIDPSRFLALDCVIAACQNWLSTDFYAEILGIAGK
jgi:hypothetical protein